METGGSCNNLGNRSWWLDQGGGKWWISGYIFKVELLEFADELAVGCERKTGVKVDS